MTASDSRQRHAAFAATCRECEVERELESANEIVEFYRRHRRQTGHDVTVTQSGLACEVPETTDIETVVAELETHYEGAVPIGAIAAAMSERGFSVGETLDELYDVRMTGALYEPRDDHLAVV
ncbi:hypothetical protein [Natrinema salifodinae]|uniref:Uncharacterized protein n=1 Tax=Natrinema salifodinae TaxID=1202768 RepID=A0A1I0QG68_9EURY|nr:hypothetical protein [Natrinema salifodinae]SEW26101.1 hypothetical protein SAMN05216285_3539 [Natrinema salifodinae]